MINKLTLISAALLLAACGGDQPGSTASHNDKAAPSARDGSDHGHKRAHEGRDSAKREARFKKAAKTLGVSEEKLKDVLRSSRDKPRNWDEIGAELGVEGDALRAALGRPNRLQQ